MPDKPTLLLARFDSPASLLKAAEKTYAAGYRKYDCHSPFPIHGMDQAMGMGRSPLGWIVGLAAIIGGSSALLLQWWASSVEYPLVISGKPFFSFQAYVPITFGLAVLLSAIAALVAMLALNGLPRHHHPIFNSTRFETASDDAFFMSVEAEDPLFDVDKTRAFLESSGGKDVEVISET